MKKIGIITWHNYPNLGSALQAYALHTFINNQGGNATIIDYISSHRPSLFRLRLCLSYIDSFVPRCLSNKLHYRFIKFEHSFFKKTEPIYTYEELVSLNERFDSFICGSDQIWAPNVFNDIYMLSFVNKGERYSYAASIGLPEIPISLRDKYLNLLQHFDNIAVREESGKELLKRYFNLNSEVVLDPTLLLTKCDWKLVSSQKQRNRKKYLLCYFLGTQLEHRTLAIDLAKKMELEIVILSRFQLDNRIEFRRDVDAGPQEFLSYIDHADFVLTDSFHGTCFSIIYNKEFYVVERFKDNSPINQNSRIYNILSKFNLNDRLIKKLPEEIIPVNYGLANNKIEKERRVSAEYLNRICRK